MDPHSGLITDETLDPLPEPYRVGRYGSSPNQVAITFDDGPDPEWTPKILDVLKREHAPATFFLIGIQADQFAGVTSRIYTKATRSATTPSPIPTSATFRSTLHEVGAESHRATFCQPLGIRTILFRPPYSIDAEPDTEDQVRPLEVTQDMGYVTIGDKIDPNDWRDNPRLLPKQIADFVLEHLPPCARQ